MKSNLALVDHKAALIPAEIYYAEIIMIGREVNADTTYYTLFLTDQSQAVALKAESCLLLPEVGDLVLVSSSPDNQIFILQILNRSSNIKVIDLGLETVITAKKVKFEAAEEFILSAPEVTLSGIKGNAVFSHTSLVSNWAEIRAQKALVIIHNLEQIFHTVTEKIVNCYRTIEGIAFTKASSIRTLVSDRMFIKSKHTTLDAEEEVTVNAKQIHLG